MLYNELHGHWLFIMSNTHFLMGTLHLVLESRNISGCQVVPRQVHTIHDLQLQRICRADHMPNLTSTEK